MTNQAHHSSSTELLNGKKFFCSWSGGKDSALALENAIQMGGRPEALFTMLAENGEYSRSHALPKALLDKQAQCLNLPIDYLSASWQDYEVQFIAKLKQFKQAGFDFGVFGDIDIQSHIDWVQGVCAKADIIAIHPLWQKSRQSLLDEFIAKKFQAKIIVVNDHYLDNSFIGKDITPKTIAQMQAHGIDASGEEGEYHTVVFDGPIFNAPLNLIEKKQYSHEGYHFLAVDV